MKGGQKGRIGDETDVSRTRPVSYRKRKKRELMPPRKRQGGTEGRTSAIGFFLDFKDYKVYQKEQGSSELENTERILKVSRSSTQ